MPLCVHFKHRIRDPSDPEPCFAHVLGKRHRPAKCLNRNTHKAGLVRQSDHWPHPWILAVANQTFLRLVTPLSFALFQASVTLSNRRSSELHVGQVELCYFSARGPGGFGRGLGGNPEPIRSGDPAGTEGRRPRKLLLTAIY